MLTPPTESLLSKYLKAGIASPTMLRKIPLDALEKYLNYQMSSKELAALTSYHPVSIRRGILRVRPPKKEDEKVILKRAREKYRASVADCSIKEIMSLAKVSNSTASRIKKRYGT